VNLHDPQTVTLICVIVVAIVGATLLVARERRRAQSKRLRSRFGREYTYVLESAGDPEKAEAELERGAADLSVHHASVVENYRAAQVIASRNSRGRVSTEELRRAVVHYRALFNELLERRPVRSATGRSTDNRTTVES
jgi:hypothetical protein